MGGQAGTRGYLVQTIVALLDAFDDVNWITFTLEPNLDQEKVDVVWFFSARSRAVQVKSSQNVITIPLIKTWAEELEHSTNAEDYELRLLGPISSGVSTFHQHGKVRIPTPHSINVADLIELAAHKLDRYAERQGSAFMRPIAREMIVSALATKLMTYSTRGKPISRETFKNMFTEWLNSIGASMSGIYRNAQSSQLPRQLPPPPADFTGRIQLLQDLASDLNASESRILGLRGMGGLGKTAVALKLAMNIASDHIDGQIYFDFRGTSKVPASPQELMSHLILSLRPHDPPPAHEDAYPGVCRTLLNERKLLLVLENVGSAEQLEPALPAAGSTLIFTTRQHIVIPGLIDRMLPFMSMNEAVSLILRIAPRAQAESNRIAELCGFLPLALRLAASAIQQRPDISTSSYLERLTTARARLELVEASIELSLQLLDDHTRRIFLTLAVFPGTFELCAAAAVWNANHESALELLGKLLGFSLISWDDEQQRYGMHELVRLYCRAKVSGTDASTACTLHSQYFLSVSRAADQAYRSGGQDALDGLALFDAERKNITTGFVFATQSADKNDEAAKICSDYASESLLCRDLRQAPPERIWWERAAFGAASRLKDANRMIQHLGNLARALKDSGDIDQAMKFHRDILAIARNCGHRRDEVNAHMHIGNCFAAKDQLMQAIEEYQTCLNLARSHNDNYMEFQALSNLGAAYLDLGQPNEAFDPLRDALGLAASIDDPRMKAMALANAANVTIYSDHAEMAIEMFGDALVIVRGLNDKKTEIKVLRGLAKAHKALGNDQLAVEVRDEANKLENDQAKIK